MQAKLLRVLEQRQVRPVGSDREIEIDVRVVAATNQDLDLAVQQGKFREDLYYRLKVMLVRVPPLRERRDDIPFLAETFLQRYITANHLAPRRFTRQALRVLEQYDWPGNVRELSHVIERAVTLSVGERIDVEDLGLESESPLISSTASRRLPSGSPGAGVLPESTLNLDTITQNLVHTALQQTHGHKGRAAALLGIHPRTLTRMMRRYSMPDDL
jgi:DNA-binding NtrC family response regulator